VRLPEFEGPLDVLLFFVQREELPIAQVPLARLVEQFLEYVRWVERVDLDAAADFVAMAAELLALKARWLLRPQDRQAESDEPTLGETAEPLVERLAEYRRYKYAAAFFRQQIQSAAPLMLRGSPIRWSRHGELAEWEPLPVSALAQTLQELLRRLGRNIVAPPLREELSVAETMEALFHAVRRHGQMPFSALIRARSVAEVIVCFIALLELVRQERLAVEQAEPFGEIMVFVPVVYSREREHAASS
jgi:segregation and condensation protein A